MSSQEPEIRFENLAVGDLSLDNPLDIPPTVVPVREAVPSDYVWTNMDQLPDSAPTGAPYSATVPYPNPPGEENGGTDGPIKQIRVLLTRQTAPDENILLASTTGGGDFANPATNVVENVIAASLGDGYAPSFEYGGGSEGDPGTQVPYDPATWAVDGLTGRVAFVDPATLDGYEAATAGTTYYYLNYWQYTGGVGGGGGGTVSTVTNATTDAAGAQPLVTGTAADPAHPADCQRHQHHGGAGGHGQQLGADQRDGRGDRGGQCGAQRRNAHRAVAGCGRQHRHSGYPPDRDYGRQHQRGAGERRRAH